MHSDLLSLIIAGIKQQQLKKKKKWHRAVSKESL